jgi:hypothetical protein
MSTPLLKTVLPPPPPLPGGTDVRLLRDYLAQLQRSVAQCVHALNQLEIPYTPRTAGAGNDPAKDPAYYTTIGGNTEGSEAAETTTWTIGDVDGSSNKKGCWFWVQSRQAYYHAGDQKWYAYARKCVIDTNGLLYSVSAETRIEIEVPETA